MAKGLRIAEPPSRRQLPAEGAGEGGRQEPSQAPSEKFSQVRPEDKVQFNKRVTQRVADGFEMLAIRTHRKVPDLLAEALSLLEERYGRV
jgi:hypothetical protein